MKKGIESLGRLRAQGIALLFITFLVGLVAGFAAERLRASRTPIEPPPPGMGRAFRTGQLPPMFHHLGLTAEQQERIARIMDSRRPQTEAILDEMLPRLRAVTDSIHREIRAVLTPEQAERWDRMLSRMHGRRRMMGPRGPGAGRGAGDPRPPVAQPPGR